MGEYATYRGSRVKIGTCENLTDIRAEHVPHLTGYDFDPATLAHVRFRFPFPDEDGMQPGDVRTAAGERGDLDRVLNLPGVELPEEVEHSTIHYAAQPHFAGPHRVTGFPCPAGPVGRAAIEAVGAKVWDAPTGINIAQQRAWNGALVLVAECPVCTARFRYPTIGDVQPVLDAIEALVARADHDATLCENRAGSWASDINRHSTELRTHTEAEINRWRYEETRERTQADRLRREASTWAKVGERILAGYVAPPAFVAATAEHPAFA